MSMYLTDSGTSYSSSFYTISNHRVYNPETNRSLGFLVRTIPSNNYLAIGRERKISFWRRIIKWFKYQELQHQSFTKEEEKRFLEEAEIK